MSEISEEFGVYHLECGHEVPASSDDTTGDLQVTSCPFCEKLVRVFAYTSPIRNLDRDLLK